MFYTAISINSGSCLFSLSKWILFGTPGGHAKPPEGRLVTQGDPSGCGRLQSSSLLHTGVPCAWRMRFLTLFLSKQEIASGPESGKPKLSLRHTQRLPEFTGPGAGGQAWLKPVCQQVCQKAEWASLCPLSHGLPSLECRLSPERQQP